MNDRFRFRAWSKQLKRMVCIDEMLLFRLAEIDSDLVLEQCTGLKDKNGRLIYEGDIVKIPDNYEEYGFMSGERREVYFKDGGFRLKPKHKKFRGHWLEDTEGLEVVGNIHENPELLEVEK